MTQTVFLSTVSNEFGTLRRRLASLGQRTKKCHIRLQDHFFHRGVKTLQKLVEEIELSTDSLPNFEIDPTTDFSTAAIERC